MLPDPRRLVINLDDEVDLVEVPGRGPDMEKQPAHDQNCNQPESR